MKIPSFLNSKKFWIVYASLCFMGALIAFIVYSKENKQIENAPKMYVCGDAKKKVYSTITHLGDNNDVENYMKFIQKEMEYAKFIGGAIEYNQRVHVMNYDYDNKLAKVIILRATSTPVKPYREDHWIWVGYLKDEPCE
jgi:hypothetical protein